MFISTPFKNGMATISVDSFLFSFTYFMTLAILALYMDAYLGLTALETASIVMVSSIGAKVTRLLISPFLDVMPPAYVVSLSALVMSLSCLMIALSQQYLVLLCAIGTFGIAYGTNSILIRAVAGATENAHQRAAIFVRLSVITNLASMLAPLIAIYLYNHVSPRLPFLIASALMFCFALVVVWGRAFWPTLAAQKKWTHALREQLQDATLRHYFLLTALCWMIYSQLFTSLPLQVNQLLDDTSQFGYLLTFNAMLSILLAPRLQALFTRHNINAFQTLCFSLIAHAAGSLWLHYATTQTELYLALFVWTLGELLLIPTLQSCISGYAAKDILISVLAINSVAMGIGEGAGGFLGIYLIKNSGYCFLIFSVLTLFTLGYVIAFRALFAPNDELATHEKPVS
ncbi:TPA: MFS transporter [Serratia marcescens]|nr:MFS transporter [Serratia marcescens]